MQFTFLGTSAGTPSKARNVTGLALQHGGDRGWYLIDCGEGTQHQVLRTPYSLQRLRAIFITHVHGDHTYGLPGLLASASMAGRTEPLHIVAPASIREFVEVALRATDSTLNYRLDFAETGAPDMSWSDDALHVSTAALSHRVPCHAFIFTEKNLERKLLTEKLRADGISAGPEWGELQRGRDVQLDNGRYLRSADYVTVGRRPRRIVVAGDNDNPELLQAACREAQVLIHEATYTQAVADRVGPAPQHSSAARVARFAEGIRLPHLILTHFSPRYQFPAGSEPHIDEIADEAREFYNGNLHLARDFSTFTLNKDMTLTQP
jgi:ribonuclease Z